MLLGCRPQEGLSHHRLGHENRNFRQQSLVQLALRAVVKVLAAQVLGTLQNEEVSQRTRLESLQLPVLSTQLELLGEHSCVGEEQRF